MDSSPESIPITSHNAQFLTVKEPGKKRALSSHRKRQRAGKRVSEVTAEQFRDARVFSGLDRQGAADFLRVSLRTAGHWETGKSQPNYAAFKLMRVYHHGELVHPLWSEFRINRRGFLCTPENHEIGVGDLRWLSLLVRRAAAFSQLLVSSRATMRSGGCSAALDLQVASVGGFVGLPASDEAAATGTAKAPGSHATEDSSGLPPTNRGVSETERNGLKARKPAPRRGFARVRLRRSLKLAGGAP